jgi:2,4-dienoyl-CoA reductase (NADPH2)
MVPRAAFTWVTARLKRVVDIPLITSNRINTPEVAEEVLANGNADMVSLARPFLADAEFVNKAAAGRSADINTCIGCNQACLDHIFQGLTATCLVNPRAGRETELNYTPSETPKRVAVVGAGPAGLSCAAVAAGRGHHVTLFDAADQIGGQLNMAVKIPGKEEFHETLRYFHRQLAKTGVDVRTGVRATADMLREGGFDDVVLATGVLPRELSLPGIDLPHVLSYVDVLRHDAEVGSRVAIVGAGGIGVDTAIYLTHDGPSSAVTPDLFYKEWGIDENYSAAGGLMAPAAAAPAREVTLLQRKGEKIGAKLGKTHRVDTSRHPEAATGPRGLRCFIQPYRRGRAPHRKGRRSPMHPGRHGGDLRRPGTAGRLVRAAGRCRCIRSYHRRGQAGGGTGCRACHLRRGTAGGGPVGGLARHLPLMISISETGLFLLYC